MRPFDLQPARDLGLPAAERFRSLRRESGLVSTAAHLGWWALVRAGLAVWHRLAVRGREHLPADPPFVLVANHTSHLDALALAAPLPGRLRDRVFPVAAGDVFFRTPAWSALAAGLLNALPMWRKACGPHALGELRRRLVDEPCAYILFPEGGRSRDGRMGPFKPGVGMLVAGTSVPVLPCHLDGCFDALAPGRCWPRRRRITVRVGAPVTFEAVPNDRAGWVAVAAETESRVRALASRSG